MASITIPANLVEKKRGEALHRVLVACVAAAIAAYIVFLAVKGAAYYRTAELERPLSPLHAELRSSGTVGLKLGMLGLAMFGVLFSYPLRKRLKWMSGRGTTRHWLDFHAVMGMAAPVIISFHAAFRWRGLAGFAYWIMVAVALSGFIGRYVYAHVPRSLNSAKLSMGDIETQLANLARALREQDVFRAEDFDPLLRIPTASKIRSMGIVRMLLTMLRLDLARPWQVRRLRSRVLHGAGWITALGGWLPSRHAEVEHVIASARRQSALAAKTAFLERTEQIFHLWHVVHRPFSFTFVALVIVHLTVVFLLGYF